MIGMHPQAMTIVGAGPAGSLLALALARRGFAVTVFERRTDPRSHAGEAGRSINLALAERGILALRRCEIMPEVRPLLTPMRGRIVHTPGVDPTLMPYGLRSNEVIHSVSRADLNCALIEAAERQGAAFRFGQTCLGVDVDDNILRLRDEAGRLEYSVSLGPCVATDGAGSIVRRHLMARGLTMVREERLDHGYKELTIPAVAGEFALDPNALHIWPRGGFMLIALPNLDKSFTATLFLANQGTHSFASLASAAATKVFLAEQFPDLGEFVPSFLSQFSKNPRGSLGTVHVSSWHHRDRVLLLGDAAHSIVPFHGQGMNAAFEDCAAFDGLLDRHDDWSELFAEFERIRRPNAAAIAQMALENYLEMRDTVLDPKFRRTKAISLELEDKFPDRFVPRYSMVMFHPEISYDEALRRGAIQSGILDELDAHRDPTGAVDAPLAEKLVNERLTILPPAAA